MLNEIERYEAAIRDLLGRRSEITHHFFENRTDFIEKNIGSLYTHVAWISFFVAVAMSKEGMSYGTLATGSIAISLVPALVIHHFRMKSAEKSKWVRPLCDKYYQEISDIDKDIENYRRLLDERSDVPHEVPRPNRSR